MIWRITVVWAFIILLTLPTAIAAVKPDEVFSAKLAHLMILEVDGHRAFLLMPTLQHASDDSPWVWYAPTLFDKDTPGKVNRYMFDELLKRGIPVAGVDVGESYGSPDGTKIYSHFYQLAVTKYRLSAKPCLFAQSRGGLMLYNWAEESAASVGCIAAIFPVTDLTTWPLPEPAGPQYSDDSRQQYSDARDAYGMTGKDKEFRARLKDLSPVSHLSSLAERKIPIFHLHGDSDKWVPFFTNSCSFAKSYVSLGGDAKVEILKGKGHEPDDAFFRSCDLLEFLLDHLVDRTSVRGPHCPSVQVASCP